MENPEPFVVTIDLRGVKSVEETLQRFQDYFDFAYSPDDNWDSFDDSLSSLDTESGAMIKKFKSQEWPKAIHLIVRNTYDVAKNVSEKAYNILLSVLTHATDRHDRYDDMAFTFEVDNSDYK